MRFDKYLCLYNHDLREGTEHFYPLQKLPSTLCIQFPSVSDPRLSVIIDEFSLSRISHKLTHTVYVFIPIWLLFIQRNVFEIHL